MHVRAAAARRTPFPVLPRSTARMRLTMMTILSLTAWLCGAACVVWSDVRSLPIAASVTVCTLVVGGLACLRAPPAPKGSKARQAQQALPVLQGLLARPALKARPVRTGRTQTQVNFTPTPRLIFCLQRRLLAF